MSDREKVGVGAASNEPKQLFSKAPPEHALKAHTCSKLNVHPSVLERESIPVWEEQDGSW